MVRRLGSVVLLFVLCSTAVARMTITCEVATERPSGIGFNSGIERSVDFYTGRELNRATGTFNYDSFSYHALLWFSQTQVAVLEMEGFAMGGDSTFDRRNLDNLFRLFGSREFTQVNGNADTSYEITCKRFGRWIDRSL